MAGSARRDGLAVRFRTPDHGTTAFHDLVRGDVSFENVDLEDFVVWRSNDTPTFLLANVVDDADMAITHAIRGEDLLSSAPKVILLCEALGMPVPTYAHLPLLVNVKRQKLSKRRDDVAVEIYRDRGYLPEAMRNYLALLGWGPPDDVEVRPIEEIVALFDLADVNKAPAFFDSQKLEHVNAEHIRALSPTAFVGARPSRGCAPTTCPGIRDAFDEASFEALAPLVQERVRTMQQVPDWVDWLYLPEAPVVAGEWEKATKDPVVAAALLDGAIAAFDAVDGWRDSRAARRPAGGGRGQRAEAGQGAGAGAGGGHGPHGGSAAVRVARAAGS